jgi:hypothetical protein
MGKVRGAQFVMGGEALMRCLLPISPPAMHQACASHVHIGIALKWGTTFVVRIEELAAMPKFDVRHLG